MTLRKTVYPFLRHWEMRSNAQILWAGVVGSRLWGFEGPGSDHDVRFLYLASERDYLRLSPRRLVVEEMVDLLCPQHGLAAPSQESPRSQGGRESGPGVFSASAPSTLQLDLVGWDIAKALPLLAKGNMAVREWLASSCSFRQEERAMAMVRSFAACSFNPAVAWQTHHSMGKRAWGEQQRSGALKPLLHAVRSALTLQVLVAQCRAAERGGPALVMPAVSVPGLLDALESATAQQDQPSASWSEALRPMVEALIQARRQGVASAAVPGPLLDWLEMVWEQPQPGLSVQASQAQGHAHQELERLADDVFLALLGKGPDPFTQPGSFQSGPPARHTPL
ncbi:hypothetical protein E3E12_07030 [Formicincola oecophyllae]|uniref:Nucleotidyltransferase domain-containing protein n=1 Tax=Formicincola oecophyllae TaxID=2558361 RepID=A0A4Y6UAK5_9PROT|nr:nucleotidyltransferase domain-containing protein [Formicincola oecophyllae]QDH13970.1 hypothetical protein E3E12_07030 [Formicincola oecophyllae]